VPEASTTALEGVRPFWVAGERALGCDTYELLSPFSGEPLAEVALAGADDVERAVVAAVEAFPVTSTLPAHVRAAALTHVARRLTEEGEELARVITAESGKPIRWARVETARGAANFQRAAEECKRFSGDMVRLDDDPVGTGRIGLVRRFPIGPVLGITPFNFPMNLVAHKVAPALAVGAPIILKPAPQTPLTALRLAELIAETDLPAGAATVLPVPHGELLDRLVQDPRLPIVSYTGSEVGWQIKASVPKKRVLLELGGNAAAIVHADAPVEAAAQSIALGAFVQAGQTCISTQRVYVHASIRREFTDALVASARALRTGDPFDEDTIVGPMVSAQAADRVTSWIREAVDQGAELLCGGDRDGSAITPTVLAEGSTDAHVWRDEVFGPVVALSAYSDVDDAFGRVNDSRFGLQAGIFTSDIALAMKAHRELSVGTVIVGDSPSFRADSLPYGGWKESGAGREGVRFAMNEITDSRALILNEH
jgi:acyl-CoA reductase-like NAD-dependent aldehyde dehydrogenase